LRGGAKKSVWRVKIAGRMPALRTENSKATGRCPPERKGGRYKYNGNT
jgi:hypothetical protein